MTDLDWFQNCCTDTRLRAWLVAERESTIKHIVRATDPVAIARAQGKILFLESTIELMDKAKSLRGL